MATLNVSKWGEIVGDAKASATLAHEATNGTASSNPTSPSLASIRYHSYSSGRGHAWQFTRTYFYFDTTSLSSVTAATININIYQNYSSNAIVYKAAAFGGTGGSNLTGTDFDNINFTVPFSGTKAFTSQGWDSITLNSDGRDQINNQNYLIVALVNPDDVAENTHYFRDDNTSIDWRGTVYLDYETGVVPSPSPTPTPTPTPSPIYYNIDNVNGVTSSNIQQINNIFKINPIYGNVEIDNINGVDLLS